MSLVVKLHLEIFNLYQSLTTHLLAVARMGFDETSSFYVFVLCIRLFRCPHAADTSYHLTMNSTGHVTWFDLTSIIALLQAMP